MTDKPLCVVCGRRKGSRLGKRACNPCATFTAIEGTREKYGLAKPKLARRKTAPPFMLRYNKLISEGKTVEEIAAIMGLKLQSLKNKTSELRQAGYKLTHAPGPRGRRIEPQEPIQTNSPRANGHGEGKTGVGGCNCEPCLEIRRVYRANWEAANPGKVEKYRLARNAAQRAQYHARKNDKPS